MQSVKPTIDDSRNSRKSFRGWLVRKNYAAWELRTHVSQFVLFSLCARKSLWFRNFTGSDVKRFEAQNTRNLSHEVTTATWINLYTRFIYRMFLCCEHISQTSHESSVADLRKCVTKKSVVKKTDYRRSHAY